MGGTASAAVEQGGPRRRRRTERPARSSAPCTYGGTALRARRTRVPGEQVRFSGRAGTDFFYRYVLSNRFVFKLVRRQIWLRCCVRFRLRHLWLGDVRKSCWILFVVP